MKIRILGLFLALAAPAIVAPAAIAGTDDAARAARLEDAASALELKVAQLIGRPPADIQDGQETIEQAPIQRVQDSAGLGIRLDRLDNQLRGLTGEIEQLQFQQKRLEEQLRKAQQDNDFRFQELGGKPGVSSPRRGDAGGTPRPPGAQAALPPIAPADAGAPAPGNGVARRPRNDAFDPDAQPGAPGAPKPLGGALPGPSTSLPATSLPVGPIGEQIDLGPDPVSTPVDLNRPGLPRSGNSAIEPLNPGGAPVGSRPAAPPALPSATPPTATPSVTAALPPTPATPRDDYQAALASLKQGQYETAEQGLRSYILKNPRSHLLPDATYYLGESFFQRGRHREAAEQFLKLSTDYSGSTRAPDGLLRLGMSLKAMGAGEQACATFGEIARKYPAAPITVRKGAEREMQRDKC